MSCFVGLRAGGLVFAWWGSAMQVQPSAPAEDAAPFELLWSAPRECPDAAAARATIERQLGRTIGDELGRGVRVAVVIDVDSDLGWRTTIAFDGPRGRTTRELVVATDCARAVEAAAVVIAISFDPTLGGAPEPIPEPPPEPEPEPDPGPPEPTPTPEPEAGPPEPRARGVAAPPPVADLSPRRAPRRSRSLRGAIGLVGGAAFGGLPRVGGLVRLHGALLGRRWRVEVGGTFAGAPGQTTRETTGSATLTMQRVAADARGCVVFDPLPWLDLAGCGGLEAGVSFAQAEGIAVSSPRRDPWVAGLVTARVGFVVAPRFALVVGPDLGVVATRRDYTVAGLGSVHQTGPVTGAAVAGLELRFP